MFRFPKQYKVPSVKCNANPPTKENIPSVFWTENLLLNAFAIPDKQEPESMFTGYSCVPMKYICSLFVLLIGVLTSMGYTCIICTVDKYLTLWEKIISRFHCIHLNRRSCYTTSSSIIVRNITGNRLRYLFYWVIWHIRQFSFAS